MTRPCSLAPRRDVDVVRLRDKVLTEESPLPLDASSGRRKVLLDLDGVELATAGGLGKLLRLNKRLRKAGGELTLCNVAPRVYELLEVTRLTEVLDVRPKEADQAT
jgi:anti-anti-sigma factor